MSHSLLGLAYCNIMLNVVVTFKSSPEARDVISHILDGVARVFFIDGATDAERGHLLSEADVLMSGYYLADLDEEERAGLASVKLIQLMSAGANRVPFARGLSDSVLIAGNVGAYA